MQQPSATPKTILVYYMSNKRTVALETLCREMNKTGNKLIVLTQAPKGDLHLQLDLLGVENYSKVFSGRISLINYLRHFFFLLSFCKKNKIDVLWSNLNSCNIVAVFAQHFIKARTVIFRHHFHASIKTDGFSSVNRNERYFDRMVGRLAKEIVVPSVEVRDGMINFEKISEKKISIIPYIYDFSQYAQPDPTNVERIKNEFKATLLIITASRMIKMKRHALVMPVFNKLIKEGYDIKVMLMDEGEEKGNIEAFVKHNQLENRIFFLGFRRNIIDYLSAADLLVHPSHTEASSSMVKEAGLMKKPVIVCKGVGDFDQYIVHMCNGFVVNPPDEAGEFEKYIRYIYENGDERSRIGEELRRKIIDEFSPSRRTMETYLSKT